MRAPLVTGTIVSLAVTAAWAWMSALTIGPAGPLHLTWRHPAASYVLLAAAPTGNGWELFAVVAFIYAECFVAGWRHVAMVPGTHAVRETLACRGRPPTRRPAFGPARGVGRARGGHLLRVLRPVHVHVRVKHQDAPA
jgi:hypothetical protein